MRTFTAGVINLGVLLLVASFAGAGCSSDDPISSSDEFSNPISVEVTFPDDWVSERGTGILRVIGAAPSDGPNDRFNENLNVAVESIPEGMSWEVYLERSVISLQMAIPDFEILGSDNRRALGFRARRHVYRHRVNSDTVRGLQYILWVGSEACIITAVAEPETFDRYLVIFEDIVASLRVE